MSIDWVGNIDSYRDSKHDLRNNPYPLGYVCQAISIRDIKPHRPDKPAHSCRAGNPSRKRKEEDALLEVNDVRPSKHAHVDEHVHTLERPASSGSSSAVRFAVAIQSVPS